MQIVIDIPEDDYHDILQYTELKANTEFENLMIVAIKNGTALPKGHGKLIDINEITAFRELECNGHDIDSLNEFTTIIEADKEVDNG